MDSTTLTFTRERSTVTLKRMADDLDMSPAERGEEHKRLGLLAQKEFDLWCTRNHLTVNPSKEDDEGWDFFVQDKTSVAPRPFLDQEPPAFSALVQVKGTTEPSGTFTMTLSNALKLVRYQGPAFIAVCFFENDSVRATWLIHCGDEFVRRVLATAVEDGDSTPANKRRLAFTPSDDDRLEPQSLRSHLARVIGDPRTYYQHKRDVVNEVGYEDGRFELSIFHGARSSDEAYDQLADFAIGVREVVADSVDVYDVRFGSRRLTKTLHEARLTRPPAPSDPETILVVRGGGEEVRLNCRTYLASAYVPFLPKEFNKLRLVAQHVEFLVGRDPANPAQIRLRWTTKDIGGGVKASDLDAKAQAAKLFRLLRSPGASAALIAESGVETAMPISGEFRLDDDAAVRYLSALEHLKTVAAGFTMPTEHLDMPADPIFAQADELQILASIAAGSSAPSETRFAASAPPPGVVVGDHVAFLMLVQLRVRGATLAVMTALVGPVEAIDQETWSVRTLHLPRLSWRLVPQLSRELVLELFDEAERQLASHGTTRIFRPPIHDAEGRGVEATEP